MHGYDIKMGVGMILKMERIKTKRSLEDRENKRYGEG